MNPQQAGPQVGQGNPLARYFRAPGVHVRLPSNGAYMPRGSVSLTATGEVPVYPLRAADEILLKNPDALMSGQAVEEMLRSCVPAIQEPRLISMPDLDVLFLAVRAASYGPKMEVEAKCPKCEAVSTFDADLPSVLTTVTQLPESCPVRLSDEVIVYLRPYNLRNASVVSVAAFTESRYLQNLENATDQERSAALNESFRKIHAVSNATTADCVLQVSVPDQVVTDPHAIREFLANIPGEWTKKIEAALKELNGKGMDKRIGVQCSKCSHEWHTELEFDPSSFFGQSS
jgi:hypothetical protein